jgi:hypothetical protein
MLNLVVRRETARLLKVKEVGWEGGVKMYLKEVGWEGGVKMYLKEVGWRVYTVFTWLGIGTGTSVRLV